MSTLKQLSVMVENKIGRLAKVTGTIGQAGANILGFSIAEEENFGILRFLLDHPAKAYKALKSDGYTVSCTDVIAISMEDRPGGLHRVAKRCGELGVNIIYAYAFRHNGNAVLVLKVDDTDNSVKALLADGFQLLDQKDLA